MASDRDEGVIWQGAHWRYPSWHMRVLEHELEAAGCKPSDWVDRPLASAIQDLRHERDEARKASQAMHRRAQTAEGELEKASLRAELAEATAAARWKQLYEASRERREREALWLEYVRLPASGDASVITARERLRAALGLDDSNTPVTPASLGAGGGGEVKGG